MAVRFESSRERLQSEDDRDGIKRPLAQRFFILHIATPKSQGTSPTLERTHNGKFFTARFCSIQIFAFFRGIQTSLYAHFNALAR